MIGTEFKLKTSLSKSQALQVAEKPSTWVPCRSLRLLWVRIIMPSIEPIAASSTVFTCLKTSWKAALLLVQPYPRSSKMPAKLELGKFDPAMLDGRVRSVRTACSSAFRSGRNVRFLCSSNLVIACCSSAFSERGSWVRYWARRLCN